ncbi:copper chaperone [Arthrobacter sp. RT-1]|uniref:heavy-metal-associated domain-containing protein n=1 Tax=Arthrobacter sp. RT-1 TaxID=2292263 RepID=UPI000E1F0C4A|nr:cation transporter [Arthrobacter sp. RT-1]RDV09448.1 copper chaperone [Arthrobacter sp. RT-1]
MNIENRTTLPLASSSGCSCCSPAAHALKPPAAVGIPGGDTPDAAAPTQRTFSLEGLTCGHCVKTVESAVSALDGVESASVDLVPVGRSRLNVSGHASDDAVRASVISAGYSVAAH